MGYKYSARTVPGHYATAAGNYRPHYARTYARYETAAAALSALFDLLGTTARPRRVVLESFDGQGLRCPDVELSTSEARAVIKRAKGAKK